MNTKQLTYPTIQEQEQFWIDKEHEQHCLKEAVSDNATSETREVKAITEALWQYHHALDTHKHGSLAASELTAAVEIALGKPWIRGATLNVASNPQREASTTADPKPKDIGGNELPDRIEANQDWYEAERNDFDRGDLRDEGRNPDGSGMSYGERNA